MTRTSSSHLSRRDVLRAGILGSVAVALHPAMQAQAAQSAPILKAIPSSGEKIPVIGLGTNAYGVIDTAAAYGRSEEVIGELLAGLGNRKDYFLATKTPMGSLGNMKSAIDESFRRLRTEHIELLQVHNMNDADQQLPAFIEYQQAKKIRYL